MKKIICVLVGLAMSGLASPANAYVNEVVNLDYAGNIFAGTAVDGGGYWNSTAGYNTNVDLFDSVSSSPKHLNYMATVAYTNDSGTIISATGKSSAMSGTSYAKLFDGYMTASAGPGAINFSGLDAKATYELVVYSQQEADVPNKTLQINGSTVLTNDNNHTSLTKYVNYAVISNLYSDGAGNLSLTYLGSINGFQLKETSSTPEPASMVLLGVGGLLTGLRRKKSLVNSVLAV